MQADFKHIIDEHHKILYKIGRSYTNDQVDFEDLYQEMLIQIWQSISRFEGKAKRSTFIYKIALNTALTHHKKSKKRVVTTNIDSHSFRLKDTAAENAYLEDDKQQQIDLLYTCINELKKEDRAIILLQLEGRSYEEMAEITGLKSNNIGVRVLRIKKKLQQLLIARGYARV